MSSSFPTNLDNLRNPLAGDLMNSLYANHADQHIDLNDAVEAIQAKIGVTNSSVSDSLEYRLSQIEAVAGITIVRYESTQWESLDPDLLSTQIGLEVDTLKFKIGNGSSWLSTAYANVTPSDLDNSLGDYVPVGDVGSLNGVASLDSDGLVPDSQIPSGITRDTELSSSISTHNSSTTSVHGISDTSALATKTYADSAVSTHSSDTTSVHGISDTSELATKTYADTAAANAAAAIVDSAPSALNTLNELAAAINDDASYAATITTALGNKQDKVSGVSDTEIGYLDGVTSAIQSQINDKASLTHVDLISYGTTVTGTSHTISSANLYKLTEFTNSSAITVTIPSDPTDSDFPIGSTIELRQMGSGRIELQATSPAEVVATDNYLKTRTQYSSAVLEKRASNSWILTGDIDA